MANALFSKGKQGLLDGSINLESDDICWIFLDASYTLDLLSHEFIADLTGEVERTGALTGKTFTAGVFRADAIVSPPVSGSAVTQWALAQDTGSDATSRLIAYYDTGSGVSFTPSGAPITVTPDAGSNGIFKI